MNELFLTAQIGGPVAGMHWRPITVKVRKQLKKLKGRYCTEIVDFKLFLRVGGEITVFKEQTGIHHVRLLKKKKSVAADIILNRESWQNRSQQESADLLRAYIIEGIEAMCRRIEKEKIAIDTEGLLSELNTQLQD